MRLSQRNWPVLIAIVGTWTAILGAAEPATRPQSSPAEIEARERTKNARSVFLFSKPDTEPRRLLGVDRTGKVLFEVPGGGFADVFSEGLAAVNTGDFKSPRYGYIDETGRWVIPAGFQFADSFEGGLALVKFGDKFGYINRKGEWVIEPQYSQAHRFNSGRAAVKKDGKWFYIDSTGKIISETQMDEPPNALKEGLAKFRVAGKWGYVDASGKMAIEARFDDAGGFSEGLAAVKVGDKWGFIDCQGQMVIQPQFDGALPFREGLAAANLGRRRLSDIWPTPSSGGWQLVGGWGFIDRQGHFVIKPEWYQVTAFSEGLAPYYALQVTNTVGTILEQELRMGYMNRAGEVVIKPEFDSVHEFTGGVAEAHIRGKFEGLIDKTGRVIFNVYDGQVTADFALQPGTGKGPWGVVLDTDRKPLAGAAVFLAVGQSMVSIYNNRVLDNLGRPSTTTGPDGRFSFPPEDAPWAVFVIDDRGFAMVKEEELSSSPEVVIEPWGRIEGIVKIGAKLGAEEKISAYHEQRPQRPGFYLHYIAGTDGEGRFVIDRMVPGDVTVGRITTIHLFGSGMPAERSHVVPVEVESGRTAHVTIGGTGRPVVGRIRALEGFNRKIDWTWCNGYIAHGLRSPVRYPFRLRPDGSFRVEDVPAGTYELRVTATEPPPAGSFYVRGKSMGTLRETIKIPEMPGGRSDEPLDVGTLEIGLRTEEPSVTTRPSATTQESRSGDLPSAQRLAH